MLQYCQGDVFMKKIIITLGRQFGCGARDIGKRVAENLGIDYFDKEIMKIAAKESGIDEKLFAYYDERPSRSFLYNVSLEGYSFMNNTASTIEDRVFQYQFEAIKKAGEKSCVIVGRCADYIFDGDESAFRVFIRADDDYRLKRVMNKYSMDEKSASKEIRNVDKKRAKFHDFYSDSKWGDASSYDLCINVSKLGADNAVDIICECAKRFVGE